jgi:hypothetical protein
MLPGSLSGETGDAVSTEDAGDSPLVTIVPEEFAVEAGSIQTLVPLESGGSRFIVTDLTTSTEKTSPGGMIKVFATVENIGDQAGGCVVLMVVNGEVETSETIASLTVGSKDLVQFEFTRDIPDTYKIQIGEEVTSVVVAQGINTTRVVIIVVAVLGVIGAFVLFRFLIRLTTK